jgi:hypothetical protein
MNLTSSSDEKIGSPENFPVQAPYHLNHQPETIFLNFWGAQEPIPPAFVDWRAVTTALFLLGF